MNSKMHTNQPEDCFHLGVKALIQNNEQKILLLEKERSLQTTYWDIPGGRIQKKETLLMALRRELNEEIALAKINQAAFIGTYLTNVRIAMDEKESVGLILSIVVKHQMILCRS